ncbi:hypothetical protein EYF80_045033 [Liparis tanakae]|uniref:Uncharacterized protein n=1 Tax=Liparis tanakae TaxID=230148 RepID=A0A4Z2FW21_9TELE|nr:hypothetical protein EYF80_045033 [Liparis tanakae]
MAPRVPETDHSVLTLDQSLHHLLALLMFAVVTQECAEGPSSLSLNRQHLLQHQEPQGVTCLSTWAHISGEDGEDAKGEVLVQQFPRQQSRQTTVTLQQLLMQPPAQREANLLLREQQSRQQLRELMRKHPRGQRRVSGHQRTKRTEAMKKVLSSGQNCLQSFLQTSWASEPSSFTTWKDQQHREHHHEQVVQQTVQRQGHAGELSKNTQDQLRDQVMDQVKDQV